MDHLNQFKSFNKGTQEYEESTHYLCKKYHIYNYTINDNGYIDVDYNADLSYNNLNILPLKFRSVGGYFACAGNGLKSLERSPQIVGKYFNCSNNKLTSLAGCPKNVKGSFSCGSNELISLEGAPKEVGSIFNCKFNNLRTLKGCPERIGDDFYCSFNMISSFEYFPKYLGGNFYCDNNPIYEIWELFKDKTKIELFNDMDIIQDGVVILDRLNYFLEEIEKPSVEFVKRFKYK